MIFALTISLLLNLVLWLVSAEAYKTLMAEREMRQLAERQLIEAHTALSEREAELPITAADIIRKKREDEIEAKKKAHGPQPVSWVGKAALLEALTEDARFERAQIAHKEI